MGTFLRILTFYVYSVVQSNILSLSVVPSNGAFLVPFFFLQANYLLKIIFVDKFTYLYLTDKEEIYFTSPYFSPLKLDNDYLNFLPL